MAETKQIDPNHAETRTTFRALGFICLILGICLVIGGIADTASAPQRTIEDEISEMIGPGGMSGMMPGSFTITRNGKPIDTDFGHRAQHQGAIWLFFLGVPLIFAGVVFLSLGYRGAMARYEAAEMAPVQADTVNYIADEIDEGVETMAAAVGRGLSGAGSSEEAKAVKCPKCGVENRMGARFCDGCGAALAKLCSSCGEVNDSQARFCDKCGAALGI